MQRGRSGVEEAEKRERDRNRERREGGRRQEEMSWWRDAGVADTGWESGGWRQAA